MTKAIIFATIAFLVSAAATTGVMVKLHVPVPDAVASQPEPVPASHADSSSADTAAAVRPDTARPDSAASAVEPTVHTLAPEPTPHRPDSPAPVVQPPRHIEPDPAALAAAYKQVARVLAAMKPPQAAKVLTQLSDDEVEGILRAVGPRQAADFLANLSVERAGVLSRRLLKPDEKAPAR